MGMGMGMAKQVMQREPQRTPCKDGTQAAQGKLRCLVRILEEGKKGNKRGERRGQGGLRRKGEEGRVTGLDSLVKQ